MSVASLSKPVESAPSHRIGFTYLSQEDLLHSGCFDFRLAISAAEAAILEHRRGKVLFPGSIVQIFNHETHQKIDCHPATLHPEEICGMKWVSAFPPNIEEGLQILSALFVLSEFRHGFPVAVMEGTLASNMRVGAIGAIAARHLAREDSRTIGFIGAGEQAKMHLLAMKTVRPSLVEARVSATTEKEAALFVSQLSPILPDMKLISTGTNDEAAASNADIVVTATRAQAPLLKAAWMKPGAFYSHLGDWEDEYEVAQSCDKIICDHWGTVKQSSQTLSRIYRDGLIQDEDIYCDLEALMDGEKPGRESADERIYFSAAGLAHTDVAIAWAMYNRALEHHAGQELTMQQTTVFEHSDIVQCYRR